MDAREWLGLQPTHNPLRWYLPIVPGICTGGGFLFGGSGLGAAISALEGSTQRPVIWATAQYLSFARPGTVMDIDVTIAAAGRSATQARAVGMVAGTEILTVNAALGMRDFAEEGQWVQRPDVPPPADCEARRPRHRLVEDTINQRIDERWAVPPDRSGRCVMWTRLPELLTMSAPTLAVLGDFVPAGIGTTLTTDITSRSLDNTLRVARIVPTDWVLVDIRVDVVAHGVGHGQIYLWAEDGTLMATASQSAMIREWKER